MKLSKFTLCVVGLMAALSLSACTKDWWTRGQPPSVGDLLERSSTRLDESLKDRAYFRKDVANISQSLRGSLTKAVEQVKAGKSGAELSPLFTDAQTQLLALEGKLSITERAPYSELSGQFRRFHEMQQKGEAIQYPAFGLFTARVMFFLADELKVPAPEFS